MPVVAVVAYAAYRRNLLVFLGSLVPCGQIGM